MTKITLAVLLSLCTVLPAGAASVAKTYSYFTVGGRTLDEIETELSRRGPQVKSTGRRHPGATQMEFTTRLGYAESSGSCRIVQANVTVKAKVILPRWSRPGKAKREVRLIWDTLSSDIKRHEESHVSIAKNYARDLEQALLKIGRQDNCRVAGEKAKALTDRTLAKHDQAQEKFDMIEGKNFESRLLRLLRYRLEQIEANKKG